MTIDIWSIEYFPSGFHLVRFQWSPEDADPTAPPEDFMAVVFPEPGRCAVLSLDRLDSALRPNKWRSEGFEPELRQAIAETYPNPTPV